jgi:hypothetical protein
MFWVQQSIVTIALSVGQPCTQPVKMVVHSVSGSPNQQLLTGALAKMALRPKSGSHLVRIMTRCPLCLLTKRAPPSPDDTPYKGRSFSVTANSQDLNRPDSFAYHASKQNLYVNCKDAIMGECSDIKLGRDCAKDTGTNVVTILFVFSLIQVVLWFLVSRIALKLGRAYAIFDTERKAKNNAEEKGWLATSNAESSA